MWCKRLLALWRAHKELPWISHLMTQCISVTCFFFFFAFVHWNSCHHGVSLLSSSLQCWKWNCITPMAIWGWLPKILDSVDSLPFCNKCKVVRFCVADPLACFEGLKPVCGWLPAHGFYPSAVCVCCRLCRIILCTILHESVIFTSLLQAHHVFIFFSVDYNKKNPGVSYHVSNDWFSKTEATPTTSSKAQRFEKYPWKLFSPKVRDTSRWWLKS